MKSVIPRIMTDEFYPDEPWTHPDYLDTLPTRDEERRAWAIRIHDQTPLTQEYEKEEELPLKRKIQFLEEENKYLRDILELEEKTRNQLLDDKCEDVEEIKQLKKRIKILEGKK